MSHTFATLELSPAAYNEIREKLKAAGYEHALHDDGHIDLHGLAANTEHEAGCYSKPYPEGRSGPCACRVTMGATRPLLPPGLFVDADAALKATESAAAAVGELHELPDPENPFAHDPTDRLLRFKKYVHERLDQMNVPADPEPLANAANGCRIEGRLNWLLDQMIEAENAAESLTLEVARKEDVITALQEKLNVPGDLVLLKKRGLYYRTEMAGYAEGILYAGAYPRAVAEEHARGSSGEVQVVTLAQALEGNMPRIDRSILLTVLKLRGEL